MIEDLIKEIYKEAKRESFPLDLEVYQAAGKEAHIPILYAGNLRSQICFFGRDLGRDEVYAGQPLYGAAGTLVREGFYHAIYRAKTKDKKELEKVCERLLLTNTVPYKPPENKAYSTEVKERFRPFIEQLLVTHWQGNLIITLGNEAFHWFAPYGNKGELKDFFQRSDRYSARIQVTIQATSNNGIVTKTVSLLPLPHPSPLNQRYYAQFPKLLQNRLNECPF